MEVLMFLWIVLDNLGRLNSFFENFKMKQNNSFFDNQYFIS